MANRCISLSAFVIFTYWLKPRMFRTNISGMLLGREKLIIFKMFVKLRLCSRRVFCTAFNRRCSVSWLLKFSLTFFSHSNSLVSAVNSLNWMKIKFSSNVLFSVCMWNSLFSKTCLSIHCAQFSVMFVKFKFFISFDEIEILLLHIKFFVHPSLIKS